MFTVVTSFSPQGFEQYGRTCVETIKAFWPTGIDLLCYWEGEKPDPDLEGFDLLQIEPAASFLRRHAGDPLICGKRPRPNWSRKAVRQGYSFKSDAYRFARKVFAVAHASREVVCGKLFWLDADTITRAPVSLQFLNDRLPDSACICYLPRPGYHCETGFVGYNLNRMETRAFIHTYEAIYAEDVFLDTYTDWDDCSIMDALLRDIPVPTAPIQHSSREQPFDNSVLGTVMMHLKGNCKYGGRGWIPTGDAA